MLYQVFLYSSCYIAEILIAFLTVCINIPAANNAGNNLTRCELFTPYISCFYFSISHFPVFFRVLFRRGYYGEKNLIVRLLFIALGRDSYTAFTTVC